jgi:hypothetical protein
VIGNPILGIETDSLVEVGHGALGIAHADIRLAAVDINLLVAGIEPRVEKLKVRES